MMWLHQSPQRFAPEPAVDPLDHLAIVVAETFLRHVTEMRRQYDIVELAEGMIDRQRLNREHVDRSACVLFLLKVRPPGGCMGDRPARGVNEIAAGLKPGTLPTPPPPARALPQHHMESEAHTLNFQDNL